jgi:hypothetical protein
VAKVVTARNALAGGESFAPAAGGEIGQAIERIDGDEEHWKPIRNSHLRIMYGI